MTNWKVVVETAKKIYAEKDKYAYWYGAKGQVLTDAVMDALIAAEPNYFKRYTTAQIKQLKDWSRGKIGLDCSGFVCYVLKQAGCLIEQTYSTALINCCTIKQEPLLIPAAGILYRCPAATGRHVGIDIGGGKFLHMAKEGSSIEMGDNHDNYWEIGGRYPAIDYSDWKEGTSELKAVANTTMYVRNAPSTSGTAIGTVRQGAEVTVLEQLDNGWLKIVWGNTYGYSSNAKGAYYRFL